MKMLTLLKLGAGLLTLFAVVSAVKDVAAHAVPESANPPIDGVVNTAPSRVEVIFTEEIVPQGMTLEVFSLEGPKVDQGDVEADLNDPERRRVSIGLDPGIAPGRYIVQWTSVSAIDDDEVSGSFGFTYDPAATPVASPDPDDATETPVPTPAITVAAASEDDGDGVSTALLIGLAAVVAAAVLAVVVWRSRTSPARESESAREET
jgi:copper transport protein